MPLIHCIYASTASAPFAPENLTALLERARQRNHELGVTGMLLHVDDSFFQVLEGPADVIDGLYSRIAIDPRHHGVTRIIREPIARRDFSQWTMGFASMSPAAVATILGSNDFFAQQSCLMTLDEGRAKKLLTAFASGRWRARMSNARDRVSAA